MFPKRKLVVRVPQPLLPGASMGAGDFLKWAFNRLGIPPCAGCERRAAKLNQIIELRPINRKRRR